MHFVRVSVLGIFWTVTLCSLLPPLTAHAQGEPGLAELPPGVLRQIQQALPVTEQNRFKNRISKTIQTQLNKVRHLSQETLKKEERSFFSLGQYRGAYSSGRYKLDSVRIHFTQRAQCVQFFYGSKNYLRGRELWLGKDCSRALVSHQPTQAHLDAQKHWGENLESLTLNLEGDEGLLDFLSKFQFKQLKALKLAFPKDREFPIHLSWIAGLLPSLSSLEKLSFRGDVTPETFDALLPSKQPDTAYRLRLKAFSFKKANFEVDAANSSLAQFIAEQAPSLQRVSLRFSPPDGFGVANPVLTPLISAIAQAKNLRHLDFQNLFAYDLEPSLDQLYQIRSLKSLRFLNADLGNQPEHLLILKQLLNINPLLETLTVRSSNLKADSIETLEEEFRALQHLRKLDLSHNPIRGLGFYRLLDALPGNNQLEELRCEACNIANHYSNTPDLAPPPGATFPRFSRFFTQLKKLDLNSNYLFDSPPTWRKCVGALSCCIFPPSASLLAAFDDSNLAHLGLIDGMSWKGKSLDYALDIEMPSLTHLELSFEDAERLPEPSSSLRSRGIEPTRIRSLKLRTMTAQFLREPQAFYAKFPNVESLELSWVSAQHVVRVAKTLPPGLRFVKIGLDGPTTWAVLGEVYKALRIKGIHLYQVQQRSYGI